MINSTFDLTKSVSFRIEAHNDIIKIGQTKNLAQSSINRENFIINIEQLI